MAWARRAWQLPLGAHLLALAAVLAVLAPFLHLGDTFTVDEGAYAIQVADLEEGRWEYDYRGERWDPEGRWVPLTNPTRGEDGWFAYVKHPSYPVALLAATRVLGRTLGLHVLALLGALGVAAAAWLLAAEVAPGAPTTRRGAFWLAAASPVAVNAYLLWAHAPSAAAAGLATVGAVRLARTGRLRWLAATAVPAVAATLVRAEALLFALALALALAAVGLRGRAWPLRVGAPLLCAGLAGLAAVAEQSWRTAIVGSHVPSQGFRGETAGPLGADGGALDWVRGRAEGAWHSVLQGSYTEGSAAVVVAAALVLVAFGAAAARRRRPGWQRDLVVALAAAAGLYLVRFAAHRTESVTGLLAAWPVALVGVVALPRRAVAGTGRVLPAVVAVLYALAVLATQYRIGGGLEWGGRFFSPLLAPLAVLAWVGLADLVAALPRRRVAVGLVAGLAVLPVAGGLVAVGTSRARTGRLIDEVTTGGERLVVTHQPPLPGFAWRTYPRVGWMVVPRHELVEVARRLDGAGAAGVALIVPGGLADAVRAAVPSAVDVTGPEARRLGGATLRLRPGGDRRPAGAERGPATGP